MSMKWGIQFNFYFLRWLCCCQRKRPQTLPRPCEVLADLNSVLPKSALSHFMATLAQGVAWRTCYGSWWVFLLSRDVWALMRPGGCFVVLWKTTWGTLLWFPAKFCYSSSLSSPNFKAKGRELVLKSSSDEAGGLPGLAGGERLSSVFLCPLYPGHLICTWFKDSAPSQSGYIPQTPCHHSALGRHAQSL